MTDLERTELDLLVEGVQRVHGCDLRGYARPLLLLAVRAFRQRHGLSTFSGVQEQLLHAPDALPELLGSLAVRRSGFFEDPGFWRDLRRRVLPVLHTHPFVRVWHVECGTGEGAYALAVLLHEEGLLGRTRIYATDGDEAALAHARAGLLRVPLERAEALYRAAGGEGSLTDVLRQEPGGLSLAPALRQSLFFAQHHLTTDSSFNEFQLVLCRDVLLRYARPLQERIQRELVQSLGRFGFLALGRHESASKGPQGEALELLEHTDRLYRRAA